MNYRIIGYTDQINECDCCGKTELKGTYVMADDMDNELYFGAVCGARANGQSVNDLKEEIKKIALETELTDLVANAHNQYLQNQVLKFVAKKNVSLNSFLSKYAKVSEVINNFTVYTYGTRSFNITNA